MYSITDLLDLEDSEIVVSDVFTNGTCKTIVLETPIIPHYCPLCGLKMHSRGIRKRKIAHPILQDGYELVLVLKQRRWRCTNTDCRNELNEEFRFVDAFRELSVSAADIARKFKTSDTHVTEIFERYVRMKRLPLMDIISVDEVFTDMEDNCKYALVIQDFYTGTR